MEKYTLTLRVPDTDYFEVKIAAGSNDGDYIQEIEEYNDSGKLKLPYSNGRLCSTLDSIKVIKYTTDGKNYDVNIL